ncbi:hypothetical protein BC827DRAFT_1267716 [Russula dissimulans]|nr:hypothetical protein BC827DRAFT_1267716 [Russula dissimulans]
MRVPVRRLGQLAHLFSVNPATVFKRKNILPSIRRHQDPLDSDAALPSPTSTSSDAEPESAVETVPDDRTLVESRRHSSQSGEADSILLSDVPEDEVCVKPQRASRRPPSSSEPPDPFTRLSIIYPLPTAENLLAHESAHPPPVMDAPPSSSPCIPAALAPPPTHYKRGRARVMSNEGHDPDPDQLSNSPNIDPDTALRFPF